LPDYGSAKQDVRYQPLAATNPTAWVAFGNPVLLGNSNSPVAVDFASYRATHQSGFFRIEVRQLAGLMIRAIVAGLSRPLTGCNRKA
jgi:hypothetical protein